MKSFNRYPVLYVIFLLAILWLNGVNAQVSLVQGKVENRPNVMVRVIVYSDDISQREQTLASTFTDQGGNFELQVEVPETRYAFLAVGLKKGEFYLKPGGKYRFYLPDEEKPNSGSVFDELPLAFLLEAEDDSLNDHIGAFNEAFNRFLLVNSKAIIRGSNNSQTNSFIAEIREKYKSTQQKYLLDYINYSIASLESIAKIKNDEEILKAYFVTKPLLISNIQYADFIKEFFKTYLSTASFSSYDELAEIINSGRGYVALEQLISRDPLLSKDPFLTELVGVLLISKSYYNNDLNQVNMRSILNEISRNSKSREVSLVATNTLLKLTEFAYGTPASPFTLVGAEGDQVQLSDFKDKFVLLYFLRSNCNICNYYLQDLDKLKKTFPRRLEIICLTHPDNLDETAQFMRSRSYNWPLLSLGSEILLLEAYGIKAYPALILINPGNTIASVNPPLPDDGLEGFIRKYMDRFQKDNSDSSGN